MLDESTIQNLESLIKKGKRITKKDLLSIPAIAENPISKILTTNYEIKNNRDSLKKQIDFKNLITDLNNFISGDDLQFKLKFLFKLYDTNNDSLISNYELFSLLEKLCDNSIEGHKLQNIVDQTFREAKSDTINYEAFENLIRSRTKNLDTFFFVKNNPKFKNL